MQSYRCEISILLEKLLADLMTLHKEKKDKIKKNSEKKYTVNIKKN